jgi:hypothetical protein
MSDDLPEISRLFLRRYINSVSLLDVLFLLKRNPNRAWSPEEISGELRTNPSYASAQLTELAASGLISVAEKVYRYSPQEADVSAIEELERLYASRRSAVIGFIYSQPIDSIRNFADAFKIKKD